MLFVARDKTLTTADAAAADAALALRVWYAGVADFYHVRSCRTTTFSASFSVLGCSARIAEERNVSLDFGNFVESCQTRHPHGIRFRIYTAHVEPIRINRRGSIYAVADFLIGRASCQAFAGSGTCSGSNPW